MASPTGRLTGKSPALAMPYRGGKSSTIAAIRKAMATPPWAPDQFDPEDPMSGLLNYRRIGRDNRFGSVVVYKVNSRQLDMFLVHEIGSTGVRGDMTSNGVFAIAWVRRHGTERLKEAVACALLLHEHVVLLRAFEEV